MQCDDRREKGKECAVVFRLDHVVHGLSSGIANAHGGGAWTRGKFFFKLTLQRNESETCCDDARNVGVSFGHNRCGEQSGNDGMEDQRVREIREHRNSGIPEDWHRDSSSGRGTDENVFHHELAQVGHIPGYQNGSDKRQGSPECSDGEIGRRNGRGCFKKGSTGVSQGSAKKQNSEVVCLCIEKTSHRASDCRKKQRDNDSGESKGSKKGDSKGKSNKEKFKSKCYKCGKTGHMSKDCRSQEMSSFVEVGDELPETGCI